MLAIIGGSGLTQLSSLEVGRRKVVRTPYGDPSGALTFGRIGRSDVVFLARHGYGHTIVPHEVNYRANVWALRQEGVDSIISVASVGGIRNDIWPGTLVLPHQIIDYTWGRPSTFFEGPDLEAGELRETAAADDCQHPLFLHGADFRQVAPEALRVHAAAKDETVRDLQPDEVGADGFLGIEPFLDQHGAMHALGAELEQPSLDRRHGLAVVEDIVEYQHRASLNDLGRPHAPLDARAAGRRAVAVSYTHLTLPTILLV